jgi:ankyrin repeat protein
MCIFMLQYQHNGTYYFANTMLAWFYSKITSIFSSIISWFFPSYNNRSQVVISEDITNEDWEGAEEQISPEQISPEEVFLQALENDEPDSFFKDFIQERNWKNIIGLAGKRRKIFDILTSINGRTNLLNCVDCEGNTATNYVARDLCDKDNTAMLERLLRLPSVALDPQNNDRRPVLFHALKHELPGKLITEIIYKSENLTAYYNYRTAPDNNRSDQDVTGSPLHHAAHLGRTDVVKALLQHPDFSKAASLNAIDEDGNTAMLSAILKGAWEIVELLWLTGKINLSYRNGSYLSWAYNNNIAMPFHVTNMFLDWTDYSLDEAKYKKRLSYVLKKCVDVQDWNVLERLLENGAVGDPDFLGHAIKEGAPVDVVKMIFENSAKLNAEDAASTLELAITEIAPNEIVKIILRNITDLDFYFHKCITPLIYAVRSNNVELVKCLLNHPAWIAIANTVDDTQSTALNWAVYQKKWDIAKLLLEKGGEEIDVLLPDMCEKGPLDYALEKGADDEIIIMLIAHTPTSGLIKLLKKNREYTHEVRLILEQRISEDTMLAEGIIYEKLKFPPYAVDELKPEDAIQQINRQRENGYNLLSLAISREDFLFAHALISKGAKLNSIPNYIAERLLILCIRANKEDIFKQLLYGEIYEGSYANATRRLININSIALGGRESLLMAAIRHKRLGIVKLLLEDPRINIRLTRDDGNTALTLAVLSGEPEILAEVLKHSNIGEIANNIADIPGAAYRGTALHMAVQTRQPEMVKLLLNLDGMDPTISQGESYERTPLMWAAEKEVIETVTAFLKKFPDLDLTQRDGNGRSSAFYIITACPESIQELTADPDFESATSKKSLIALYVETLEQINRLNIYWFWKKEDKKESLTNLKESLEAKIDTMDALLYALHLGYYYTSNIILSSSDFHTGHKRLALPLDKDSIGHIASFLPNLDKKNAQGKTAFQLALNLGYYDFAAKLLQAGATDLGIVSPEEFTNIFQQNILSRKETISLFLRLMKGYGITTNKLEHIQNAATLLTMDAMRLDIFSEERIKSVFLKLLAAGEAEAVKNVFIKLLAAGKVEVVKEVLPQIPLSILSDITEASVPYKIPQETEGLFAVISGREEALAMLAAGKVEAVRNVLAAGTVKSVFIELLAAGTVKSVFMQLLAAGEAEVVKSVFMQLLAAGEVEVVKSVFIELLAAGEVEVVKSVFMQLLAAGEAEVGKSVFIELLAAGKVEVVKEALPQIPLSILSDITEVLVPYRLPDEIESVFDVITRREEALAMLAAGKVEAVRNVLAAGTVKSVFIELLAAGTVKSVFIELLAAGEAEVVKSVFMQLLAAGEVEVVKSVFIELLAAGEVEVVKSVFMQLLAADEVEVVKSLFIELLAAGKVEVVKEVLPQIPLSILSDITEVLVPYRLPDEIESVFDVITRREEALASIGTFVAEANALSRVSLPERILTSLVKIPEKLLDICRTYVQKIRNSHHCDSSPREH